MEPCLKTNRQTNSLGQKVTITIFNTFSEYIQVPPQDPASRILEQSSIPWASAQGLSSPSVI